MQPPITPHHGRRHGEVIVNFWSQYPRSDRVGEWLLLCTDACENPNPSQHTGRNRKHTVCYLSLDNEHKSAFAVADLPPKRLLPMYKVARIGCRAPAPPYTPAKMQEIPIVSPNSSLRLKASFTVIRRLARKNIAVPPTKTAVARQTKSSQ